MKQLDEIIELTASDDARLATILRKCLIIASKVKNDSLREWAAAELNGYDDHLALPSYRVTRVVAKGFFIGPYGAQLHNQPLPASVLKEDHRWWATKAYLQESISSYEAIVNHPEKHASAMIYWPADLVAHYQRSFFEGYALNRAWQDVSAGAIVGLVDTVRTRLLQFALEVQTKAGSNGVSEQSTDVVEHSVQTIIYGGNNVVGNIAGNVQLIGIQKIQQGDFASLVEALRTIGIEQQGIAVLDANIDADRQEGANQGFGRQVANWLQNVGSYVGKETAKAGFEVAKKAATKAVLTYFGLPS